MEFKGKEGKKTPQSKKNEGGKGRLVIKQSVRAVPPRVNLRFRVLNTLGRGRRKNKCELLKEQVSNHLMHTPSLNKKWDFQTQQVHDGGLQWVYGRG